MSSNIERIFEVEVPGKRLGRHVDLDANYNAKPFSRGLKAVQSVSWAREIPILNQGNVGSCTANATVGALGTLPNWPSLPTNHPTLNEAEALVLYSKEEQSLYGSPYPPTDNGGTGPAIAQVAVNAGLIKSFEHYTDINSLLQALQVGPVIIGINWYTSFDTPSSSGLIAITPGATVRGGHEVEMRSYDAANNLLGFDNSWGVGEWTADGSGFMSVATFTTLLAQGGDVTAFVPLDTPEPTPTPSPTPTGLVTVPGLNGHTAGFAHNELVKLGLVPRAVSTQKATDVVTGTKPKAGTQVATGSPVTILAAAHDGSAHIRLK